jgi:exosome complex exonuclease RRP6
MPKVTISRLAMMSPANFLFSKLVKEITQDSNAIEDASLQGPVLGMEVEIPFVPASQRKPTQVVEDSIVVVGQARQRKRKRTKAAAEDASALRSADGFNGKKTQDEQPNTSKVEVPGDEEEPFDFSTVPNILDNNPNSEASSVKKKKRKQKHGMYINQRVWC